MTKKQILHINGKLDCGGVGTYIDNNFELMDPEKVVFDFVFQCDEEVYYEEKFKSMGSKIYHVCRPKINLFKNFMQMRNIFKNNQYDIVHIHIGGAMIAFNGLVARLLGAKKVILHAHNTGAIDKKKRDIIVNFISLCGTHFFACSVDAGRFVFGDKMVNSKKVKIINNAIESSKFRFDSDLRKSIREKYNINDKFIIGSVGRITYQKNHEFLISIFKEINERMPNSRLLIIGEGELEGQVRDQVHRLGLDESVMFMGVRADIAEIMQGMDVFVLPSRYEGLGIVVIESQASGLVTVASDVVPRETQISDLIEYISLSQTPKYWADQILKYRDGYIRTDTINQIIKSGFDIKQIAKELEDFYLE